MRDTVASNTLMNEWPFKICLVVYKCLHQLAPPYLVSLLTPVTAISTRRHLPSADLGDLATPRTRTVGFGPRSFSAAGPSAWNRNSLNTTQYIVGWIEMFYVARPTAFRELHF